MYYLIDKNVLTRDLRINTDDRKDICILDDVLTEAFLTESEISIIIKSGVRILKPLKIHLDKLQEVMLEFADDFELIDLHTGRGAADAMMIAYILAEKTIDLFPAEITIVTKDEPLKRVASSYGINCIGDL
jgi:hypothetical protein